MGVREAVQLCLGGGPLEQKTWDDAVERWLLEKAHKASLFSDLVIIRWLNTHLSGVALIDIDRDLVDRIKRLKMASGVANSTVNRTLALLRAMLKIAVIDWEWIGSAPKVKLLREPSRRIRYLSMSQAQRLLAELPVHLAEMAAFSLATGLRKRNVTGLCWDQVDEGRKVAWIHPDQSKSRRAIAVPLNDDALRVLAVRRGLHQTHVFSYRGEVIQQVSTAAWYKALKRAGIEDFRWHDLRHTWASWHVQNGTPLHVLQELGGWESELMVRRYAHLSAAHLAAFADKMPSVMR